MPQSSKASPRNLRIVIIFMFCLESKHPREPYKRWQPGPEDMSVLSGFEEMQCQSETVRLSNDAGVR